MDDQMQTTLEDIDRVHFADQKNLPIDQVVFNDINTATPVVAVEYFGSKSKTKILINSIVLLLLVLVIFSPQMSGLMLKVNSFRNPYVNLSVKSIMLVIIYIIITYLL